MAKTVERVFRYQLVTGRFRISDSRVTRLHRRYPIFRRGYPTKNRTVAVQIFGFGKSQPRPLLISPQRVSEIYQVSRKRPSWPNRPVGNPSEGYYQLGNTSLILLNLHLHAQPSGAQPRGTDKAGKALANISSSTQSRLVRGARSWLKAAPLKKRNANAVLRTF
eukprot:3594237-Rhodomonas_salina.1